MSRFIPPLKKGQLRKYGYSARGTTAERHTALKKAVKAYGAGNVIQKLNAVSILNRNRTPSFLTKVFRKDLVWVRNTYLKGGSKSKKGTVKRRKSRGTIRKSRKVSPSKRKSSRKTKTLASKKRKSRKKTKKSKRKSGKKTRGKKSKRKSRKRPPCKSGKIRAGSVIYCVDTIK